MRLRIITAIACLFTLGNSLFGQIRVEPFVGATLPMCHASGKMMPFPYVGCDAKYLFNNVPISVGLQGAMSFAYRTEAISRNGEQEDWALRTISLLAIADWYCFEKNNFRYYVGCGAGLANRHETLPGLRETGVPAYGACFSPRIGVEYRRRVTLSLNAYITEKTFNTIGLRIGYSFGK